MYNVIDNVDLMIRETHPSRQVIDLYEEAVNYYGGLTFLFDNLSQIIYVWVPEYGPDKRGWVKKAAKYARKYKDKNKDKYKNKLVDMIKEKFLEEMGVVIKNYEFRIVLENQHPDDFEYLFLYEVQEYGLYSQHYFRSDVQMRMPMDTEPVVEEKVDKCPECGWILSKGATKCPRCKHDL